jgi:preprotein translocase subunit SecY
MRARIKAFFAWVYEWVTVLSASALGLLSVVPEILGALEGVDLAPLLPPNKALTILTCVAIVKAIAAFIKSKIEARA